MTLEEVVARVMEIEEKARSEAIYTGAREGEFQAEFYLERLRASGQEVSIATVRRRLNALASSGKLNARRCGNKVFFSEVKKEGGK